MARQARWLLPGLLVVLSCGGEETTVLGADDSSQDTSKKDSGKKTTRTVADSGAEADGDVPFADAGLVDGGASPDGGAMPSGGLDRFGVTMLYATAPGGEELFLDPAASGKEARFDAQQQVEQVDAMGKKTSDAARVDALRIGKDDEQVRMLFYHSPNGRNGYVWPGTVKTNWRNVEMTAYLYVEKITDVEAAGNWLRFLARGGRHAKIESDTTKTCPGGTAPLRCEGSSYGGGVRASDGTVDWRKELWHEGGMAPPIDPHLPAGAAPLLGRWVGLKVVTYNFTDAVAMQERVMLQIWVDWNASKTSWVKVSEEIDAAGKFTAPSAGFDCPGCKRRDANDKLTSEPLRPDDIISWGGPRVALYADGMVLRVKNLSVREITSAISSAGQ